MSPATREAIGMLQAVLPADAMAIGLIGPQTMIAAICLLDNMATSRRLAKEQQARNEALLAEYNRGRS